MTLLFLLLLFGWVETIDLFLIHFLMIVAMKRVIDMILDWNSWVLDVLDFLQTQIQIQIQTYFCTDLLRLRFQERMMSQRQDLREKGGFVECIEENVKRMTREVLDV